MTVINKPFTMYLGERKNLIIPVDDMTDLAGYTVSFSLFDNEESSAPIFTKSGSTDGNTITVPLMKADTSGLKDSRYYYYEVQVLDGTQEFSTVSVGNVSFKN